MQRFNIRHFATIGSTNDELKGMVEAEEFTVVTADEQTAGRGRRERVWHSVPGDGLYLSLLLRPAPQHGEVPLISLLTGVAVAETLIGFGASGVDIKWPNDVLLGERKISGILIEGAASGSDRLRLIVGIGVNLNHRSFPDEIAATATSLAIVIGRSTPVAEFRDALLNRLLHWYGIWREGGATAILTRYTELSSYARGKRVRVVTENGEIIGETCGLTAAGALRLRTASDEQRVILAGEVMRLREDEG